jgi:hypothetical protein
MIHILTVHWKNDHWIDIQLNYFRLNIKIPYKVYAFLDSLAENHRRKYFYSSIENIESHPIKLNLLADMAMLHSTNNDDWVMFIDGDAFPIGDIVTFGKNKLGQYPLLAIQRRENFGDKQPHPSFCLTTIKFWKEINGDWKSGFSWQNSEGKLITDVGGNLLSLLIKNKIEWYPMLRSNKKNLHPLWFGIYEDLIYHHGAGFRDPLSRLDQYSISPKLYRKILFTLPHRFRIRCYPLNKTIKKNQDLSENVYRRILEDFNFYQFFMEN